MVSMAGNLPLGSASRWLQPFPRAVAHGSFACACDIQTPKNTVDLHTSGNRQVPLLACDWTVPPTLALSSEKELVGSRTTDDANGSHCNGRGTFSDRHYTTAGSSQLPTMFDAIENGAWQNPSSEVVAAAADQVLVIVACSTGGRGFNHIGRVFDMSLLRPSESPAGPRRNGDPIGWTVMITNRGLDLSSAVFPFSLFCRREILSTL
ncbi:hypothetical protein NEUTE1DRAFT_114118 [Neurospora tetrasperma FGSC 2508]|uniref:Uncharacterized protein n=1 Tax=Neurospora tetrasperma (strain FGSC 2508 / ATCC MYA-4615 / P0657) TaxID=510951 RepID=F8N080_NEUT8|nr:uncharacterized protein NEUTE1DRAFT_114118 [Neurospora tetrasperma FGSC 2508]EGO52111.1 hypothetical protein NEUTE1DRAFT_114118 [Neurospora tetrasperma FGSC 2508]